MQEFCLYTYSDEKELHKYQKQLEKEEKNIYPFTFGDTKTFLENDPTPVIDITTMVLFINVNRENCYSALINLMALSPESKVIINISCADIALEFFPLIFSRTKSLFPKSDQPSAIVNSLKRRVLYTYSNDNQLNELIVYTQKNNIPFASFPYATGVLKPNFDKFNRSVSISLVDFTSIAYVIEDNKNIIYIVEQFISSLPNVSIIVRNNNADKILKYFPLYFYICKPITTLIHELPIEKNVNVVNCIKKRCITDLTNNEFEEFYRFLNYNLIGHSNFKIQFKKALIDFRELNQVHEQKVFSVFLFGKSGIGKTEVARIILKYLGGDTTYFAKINFENYSSQDALNSLIGSPAGYIGCEHGELSEKISKSSVGLILCDEFEKTTRPVFSFFLGLLEDGKFTDSIAREYDVNGFIVIFTSNLTSENEYVKLIPPELQNRFDLVCEFEEPSTYQKKQFLDYLFNKAQENFTDEFQNYHITKSDKQELYDFDYQHMSALRSIKRKFNQKLMELFRSRKAY